MFGMPGVGGSLGCCAVCGESFLKIILFGESCKVVEVGGERMAVHDEEGKQCVQLLKSLADEDGQLPMTRHNKLPEKSPLGKAMREQLARISAQNSATL